MKAHAKRLLHRSGLLYAHHRRRNRHTLTLVMLHRVLPDEEMARQGANPEWSLSTSVFADLLGFLVRRFNPIDFGTLAAADGDVRKLPERALLLTFDDGWRDNYLHAMPLLERYGVPAHLFVATDFVGSERGFWQEQLYAAFARNPDSITRVSALLQLDAERCTHASIVERIESADENDRLLERALEQIEADLPAERQMLSGEEIESMLESVFTLGGHGASHAKLGNLREAELEGELRRCTEKVAELTRSSTLSTPNISFPHGSYSPTVLTRCRELGMELTFCSGSGVHTSLQTPLQRIHLSARAICEAGRFDETKASFNLCTRRTV